MLIGSIFSPDPENPPFPGFEYRPQQLQMATAVTRALESGGHCIIEAPTGVGKTLAYLVPALLHESTRNRKVFVSTHTRNLQDQILANDLPNVTRLTGQSFRAVTLKGRANYLCLSRLTAALDSSFSLFGTRDQEILRRVAEWSARHPDSTLEQIPFPVPPDLWNRICSEPGICTPRTCSGLCPYQRVRTMAREAHCVILNHALLVTLLARQEREEQTLISGGALICDEAQALEAAAGAGLGQRTSLYQISLLLRRLYHARSKRGLIADEPAEIRALVTRALKEASGFFSALSKRAAAQAPGVDLPVGTVARTIRLEPPILTSHPFPSLLRQLVGYLERSPGQSAIRSACIEERRATARALMECDRLISEILEDPAKDQTYWIEAGAGGRDHDALCARPPDISTLLADLLFQSDRSVILTSATIAIAGQMEYFQSRIGARGIPAIVLDSPFEFRKQMRIRIARDIPEPDSPAYPDSLPGWILRSVEWSDGRALVLFTSNSLMQSVARRLRTDLDRLNIRLLVQGQDGSRTILLDQFRADFRSVLFGLESFWAGIDVPGEALEHVIITRLPFAVPNHPLSEARCEQISRSGGNPFQDYVLPEAILRFRQGAGRLIRNATDRGTLTVLDSRILNKSYGRSFIQSLPVCPVDLVSSSGESEEIYPAEW